MPYADNIRIDVFLPKFSELSMSSVIPNLCPSSQLVSNQFIEYLRPLQILNKRLQGLLLAI